MQECLCKPLKGNTKKCDHSLIVILLCIEVLDGYEALSSTASDTTLREFLEKIQSNATQVYLIELQGWVLIRTVYSTAEEYY